MAYQYTKRELAELAEFNAKLASHFKPGNVILSNYWNEYDLVLDFKPTSPNVGWYVKVIHCDKEGNLIPGERSRIHYTQPDRRDRVITSVNFF